MFEILKISRRDCGGCGGSFESVVSDLFFVDPFRLLRALLKAASLGRSSWRSISSRCLRYSALFWWLKLT